MRYILSICLFLLCTQGMLQAQELKADVTLNFPKLQSADPQVLQTLEAKISDFLNNQVWTNNAYEPHEKIECSFVINITAELSATDFTADMQIQALRPTYGSNYKTSLFSHADKGINFSFEEFAPIEFTENIYSSNLSSVLSYYAYMIIGMDYDSFSPYGGEDYFLKAKSIYSNLPSSVQSNGGWSNKTGVRSRFWLVDNALNPRVKPFRLAFYNYHRKGLDLMESDIAKAQKNIAASIEEIGAVNRDLPNSMILSFFLNTKVDEVVEIFKIAPRRFKDKVYQSMVRMDAANASKYKVIRR